RLSVLKCHRIMAGRIKPAVGESDTSSDVANLHIAGFQHRLTGKRRRDARAVAHTECALGLDADGARIAASATSPCRVTTRPGGPAGPRVSTGTAGVTPGTSSSACPRVTPSRDDGLQPRVHTIQVCLVELVEVIGRGHAFAASLDVI